MIYEGYVWPEGDQAHRTICREALESIPRFLEHVPGRSLVIQAGGNVGLYPNLLREHFARVITAEPDPTNYRCLMHNIKDVEVYRAAFGIAPGTCQMQVVSTGNCGAHRVTDGVDTPIITIDGLHEAPDAIWLDVEGYEYFALKGTAKTLAEHKPVVVIEEKGLEDCYGLRPEYCGAFLQSMGYSLVDRIGRDNVYRVRT